ncbi:intradiol ring-cleavage dioxygenase [Streptomyces cinnabarinus]|uniref:Intradiol ring-cleavage dioxygenase n=1 Tax=Streptomyces cinnabarinus TaxID=67287 RepID=A0ABY7KFU6_9ACTN|nr:intradiol ring-cleavage dioxygenase [Streptomyces cinnabarinus]WAZ22958.1 intradiol ring-cleavage dioxygenase [Streptomyces cinnabarinus]
MRSHHADEAHEHDRGLSHDLPVLARRRMIRLMAGAGLIPLVGCTSEEDTAAPSAGESCAAVPEETAGPFPGDGSNGVNVLKESGVVRSDITSSFGDSAGGTAEGVPLTVTLTVVDAASGCGTPKRGAAVYLWQADRDGAYSLYSAGVTDENYLRGVQETDDRGRVTFTTVFPGCYPGRWPHLHFEVYDSLADATAATGVTSTSQLAFPQEVCESAYRTDGYSESVTNLSRLSIETDTIFSDGHDRQLASVQGSAQAGYRATLVVPV